MDLPICTVQTACDGNTLMHGRTVMCGRCEEKLKKRERDATKPTRLKGEKLYPTNPKGE